MGVQKPTGPAVWFFYHVLVALRSVNVGRRDVLRVLAERAH